MKDKNRRIECAYRLLGDDKILMRYRYESRMTQDIYRVPDLVSYVQFLKSKRVRELEDYE